MFDYERQIVTDQHFGVSPFDAEGGQVIGSSIKPEADRARHVRVTAEPLEFRIILRRCQVETEPCGAKR